MVVKRTLLNTAWPRRGRPLIHGEAWSRVSVVLMDRQIVRLDRLVSEIHRSSGALLTRAGIIRALVDGVVVSGFDVSSVSSEFDFARSDRCASQASQRESAVPAQSRELTPGAFPVITHLAARMAVTEHGVSNSSLS